MVIIDIAHRGGRVRLWCMDRYDQSREARTSVYNEQALYIDEADEMPALGDDVWCDSTTVYWTPNDGRFRDRPLTRIEHSSAWPEMLNDEADARWPDPALRKGP